MTTKDQIFELKLEDYCKSHCMSAIKSYYGNKAATEAIMNR